MSQPETKRVKTDTGPEYELIYWPMIPGRGEFVRLLFEEAAVPYTDTAKAKDVDNAVTQVMELTSSTDNPVFAVPALRHGDVLLSQTSNILQYLAPKLGLAPSDSTGVASAKLNQIVLTILDGFVNELHDTHHPISIDQTYEEQKPEALKRATYFKDTRVPKYLGYVQRIIDANHDATEEEPWLYGGSLTYADLVLFQCVDGTKFAFPKKLQELQDSGKYDKVFKLYEAVKQRPNIKSYLESDRRASYSNGIWRSYPEFEEDA